MTQKADRGKRDNLPMDAESIATPPEYKVGPGRPPKEFQFKPGQSGNPKGAKRKHPSIALDLKAALSVNVVAYKPDTDKRARLIAQTDLFAGGSVRLPPRAKWREEFVAELLAFPGRHDDQVDALTQGIAWARQNWSRRTIMSSVRGQF